VSSISTEAELLNNLAQVVHTYVPLSPSSITWYWLKNSDVLWLGSAEINGSLPPWGDDLKSRLQGAGRLLVHQDQLRAQRPVTSTGGLYLYVTFSQINIRLS